VSAPTSVLPPPLKQAAQNLPSAARIFACLQVKLQSPLAGLDDIVDLVKMDPGLASAVVRAGNSATHRQGEPLESVNDAINRVGLREVHRIVGIAVAGQLFLANLPLYKISGALLWENSLATAVAMSVLSHAVGDDERPAYTLGLLRPTGRLVLQRVALSSERNPGPPPTPSPSHPAAETEWEKTHFHLSNTDVTAHLLESWHFTAPLCDAVRHHLRPEACPGNARLAARLHLACWIAATLGKGLPGELARWRATPEMTALAGLPPEATQECTVDTRDELNRLGALVRAPAAA
jgi:HD-like signal output (HDOD) protein